MAPPVEVKTTAAPCGRAPSSTCSVPSTFTEASSCGCSTDVPTSACAARWKTRSGRTSSKSASSGRWMSCSCTCAAPFRFSRRPVAKLSTTCPSSPRSSRASTRCEPMNPAPPVTTALMAVSLQRVGFLVAIEGIDGSGKGTQAALLAERARTEGLDVASFSFPRYGESAFSGLIADYLNGALGEVRPELAALLYAGDRFSARAELLQALADHDLVVLHRYVASNLPHQG